MRVLGRRLARLERTHRPLPDEPLAIVYLPDNGRRDNVVGDSHVGPGLLVIYRPAGDDDPDREPRRDPAFVDERGSVP